MGNSFVRLVRVWFVGVVGCSGRHGSGGYDVRCSSPQDAGVVLHLYIQEDFGSHGMFLENGEVLDHNEGVSSLLERWGMKRRKSDTSLKQHMIENDCQTLD